MNSRLALPGMNWALIFVWERKPISRLTAGFRCLHRFICATLLHRHTSCSRMAVAAPGCERNEDCRRCSRRSRSLFPLVTDVVCILFPGPVGTGCLVAVAYRSHLVGLGSSAFRFAGACGMHHHLSVFLFRTPDGRLQLDADSVQSSAAFAASVGDPGSGER